MQALLRISLALLVLMVLLVASAPGLIYLAGIGSVEGRPQADAPPLRPAQRQWLRCELRADGLPEAPITNPWSYALRVLRRDPPPSYGDEMSWIIARHYNATHSKRQRAMERMLSGMSMSIWIARHWTQDQMEFQVHALLQDASRFSCQPGPSEWQR